MARYEWPPLPVLDPDEASRRLAAAMQSAWDDLEAERVRVAESVTMGRKALVNETLREFQDAIDEFGRDVEYHADRFKTLHLGPQYLAGVQQGGGVPVFTAIHASAFVALATDTYDDFLRRSQEAGKTAKAFAVAVRTAARDELPKIVGGGRTALQGAQRLEQRLLNQYGLTHVLYRDGSRVPVDVYSRMVARTKSAVAYNAGTVNEAVAQGVKYMEVFDGDDCGWVFHKDTDKANGSIRTVEEVAAFSISHPSCTRAFGPRPDIADATGAADARASTTAGQRADQAEIDWNPSRQVARDRVAIARRSRIAERRATRIEQLTGGTGVRTPQAVAASLHARAVAAEPKISRAVETTVIEMGGRMERFAFRVKDAESTTRKVLSDAAHDGITVSQAGARLSDLVRYTAVLPEAGYWKAGDDIIAALGHSGHTLAKGPTGWAAKGYRGRNVKMRDASGQTYEMQVHTAKSLDAAERSHALLDLQREATTVGQYDALTKQMGDIFDAVPIPPGTPVL